MAMPSFKEICSSNRFIIPVNQRGFSWTKRELNDLLNDLTLMEGHSHYLGPLIVTKTSNHYQDDEFTNIVEYTLEDGQQRVTALLILANEIVNRLQALEGSETVQSKELKNLVYFQKGGNTKRRLKNENPDLDQYLSYILTGTPSPPADRTPPMRALDSVKQEAQAFFASKDVAELLKWKAKIQNQSKIIFVDLASENINRYLAFDAINSRGLPLSEFDKIKNFCILVATTRNLPVSVEDAWYKALTHLESFELRNRSDEAAFISELFSSCFNSSIGQKGVHEAFVDRFRKLLSQEDAALQNDFERFIGLWEPYAKSFGFISTSKREHHYGSLCTTEAGNWLDRLDNMDLATIVRPVLAASHYRMSGSDFEKIARACEIYVFRIYAVMRRRKDMNSKSHINISHTLLNPGQSADWVLQNLCKLLDATAPMKRIIETLSDGNPKYAYDPQVSGWGHCYYFLYEYEINYSPAGVAPFRWGKAKQEKINTQEHILPQAHRDGGWWESHWPNEARAEAFKHRLGNLVLTPNNSALGRKPISEKLSGPGSHHFDHANATNTEKRIVKFSDGANWQEENILAREFELIEFAARRWGMPCCSDNGVVELPEEFNDAEGNPRTIEINEAGCIASSTSLNDDETSEHVETQDLEPDSDNNNEAL
ncbi:DUF262 domain-containing protein [Aliiroseovarius marinus]|uniref:DUF262 domain-containing protein n=1 Tax=Aliiroseovarius marinus TaxID=2500159 RepID=UPI00105C2D15|nr:DUF262 domain-containing protein [Aliiroseovarius marinus]